METPIKNKSGDNTGVSRSGRVRKKSSKLADFESPDEIDTRFKRKTDRPQKSQKSLKIGQSMGTDIFDDSDSHLDDEIEVKDEPLEVEYWGENDDGDDMCDDGDDRDDGNDPLHVDDDSIDMSRETSNYSQAQSLYFSEKQGKKNIMLKDGQVVRRKKAQRKDKGSFTMRTSNSTRASIITLHNHGVNNCEIARRLGVAESTVRLWIRRHEETGATDNKPRSGRPRCTSMEEDREIQAAIDAAPFATALSIRNAHGLRCTLQTVRNRLHTMDLHSHTPAKKPLLSDINMEKRMEYALEYCDKHSNFWDHVVFCDEKTFSSDASRNIRVWPLTNTRYEPKHVVTSRRSGRVTASMFGWIHAGGVGELADVGPGHINGVRYIEILEEVLLPSVRHLLFPEPEPYYLIHNISPIHKCHIVKAWFRNHPEITLLPHPPQSPDLNPIEDVWAAMTARMPEEHHKSRSSIITGALHAWEQLRSPAGQDLTAGLVASVPQRLNSVIEAGGAYINY